MEFWGVEVKPGKPLKVTPTEDRIIHISQASLGECKSKKGEVVPFYVKVGDQKLVFGTLLSESIPQISFDTIFDKEFELSHNWTKGSVYFIGYTSPNIDEEEGGEYFDSDSEEEEEEEEVPAAITAAKAVAKPKATPAVEEEDESDSEDGMDDEDDSDDDDSEEEEETPKKPESTKKRANEAPKTPVSAKKAKVAVTPQKTEEKKKGGHTATPHPAKKGGKTPTTAAQSPKSANQVSCGSCKKTFNSGNALESHNKAKHSAAK